MRPIALLLLALAATACAVEHSMPSLARDDHRLHLGAGAVAGAISVAALDAIDPDAPRWLRVATPIVAASLLGAAKEVWDHQHPDAHTTDAGDAIATMAGGVVVALTFSIDL